MRRALAWLVALQVRRPAIPLLVVLAITLFFGVHVARLTLRTEYDALLPNDAPSVIELHRLAKRTSASQTLLVLLEGDDRAALRRMGDDVTVALRALGPDVVSSAEDGTQRAHDFLAPRSTLFLETKDLERLSAQVDARWDYEVQKADGFLLDEDAPPPPLPTAESIRDEGALHDPFPTGYFENGSGTALVVAAHSPITGGDLARVEAALTRMRAAVAGVRAASPERASIHVSYAGDMPTAFAEYHVISKDLLDVGAAGIALVLFVVLVYFMRIRALAVMGASIAVALVWTFGITQMAIGHLNVATAFLASIVAGNGINVGILYQSRYFEERARGAPAEEAIRRAVSATWRPTIIAAAASAVSYASLLATDFRAFRDFGWIAASGMLVCWVVKTAMVPPLLVLLERAWPSSNAPRRYAMTFGRPFAWLSTRATNVVAAVALVVTVGGTVAGVWYATHDPLDYDTRTMETRDPNGAELQRAWRVCNGILGSSQGAMVVATDTPDDARAFTETLRARWRAAPAGHKPFVAVHAVDDFVARDQAAKLPIARALGDRLRRANEHHFISEADWEKLARFVPPPDLAAFTVADLPDGIAGPFTEKNGTRGTLVLVEASPDTSDDLRSLVEFAAAYRTTHLPNGKTVVGSGSAVIFADMLDAVARDVPRSIVLSLVLALGVVVFTFRRQPSELVVVVLSLWTGIAVVAAYLYFANIKINFLNFAALPVTFGIGVDYAINVAQRHAEDGRKDIAATLRTSGGAVVLCSLTTLLGYLALVGSHNHAIRTLGSIAAVGEVGCLLGAVVVLPALYAISARRVAQSVRSPVTD
jgi:hypothetical protein